MTISGDWTGTLLAGRYRLEARLASGGMGVVWRARDELLQRAVAVKILHDALADDATAAARMRREALTAASISHPNMANVFDYVEEDGRPAIVMELVESETLAQRLARGNPMTIREAARITDGVLAAVGAAHDAGIIHRDIKPANILLCPDGHVKVTDFGIARATSDLALTQTGAVMGTAHYTSPEQLRGDLATPSSDLYAVGLVFYEMLAGVRAFSGDTPIAAAMARLSGPPTPLTQVQPQVPDALAQVVMTSLDPDPAARFPTASAMRRAMRAALPRSTGDTAPAARIDEQGAALGAAAADDGTRVMSVTATDPTVRLGAEPEPTDADPKTPVLPRFAARRVAMWLLPLVAIAFFAMMFVSAFADDGMTAVPRLEGLTLAEARAAAAESNVELKVTMKRSNEPKDVVLDQGVPAGNEVADGAVVPVSVSNGQPPCCTVPNLKGMTAAKARAALEEAGLDLGDTRYVTTTSGPAGTVVDQTPNAGGRLAPNDNVDIVIARAPERREEDKGKDEGKNEGKGKGGDKDDD